MRRDYYNGSGYADPTAYVAISKADRDAQSNKRVEGRAPAPGEDSKEMHEWIKRRGARASICRAER